MHLEKLKLVHSVKTDTNLTRYLGMDLMQQNGTLAISGERCLKESIVKIEAKSGSLKKEKTPMESGIHLEIDDSALLSVENHSWYRSLVGMALWAALL